MDGLGTVTATVRKAARASKPAAEASQPQRVYERLRELIVTGRLAPGSRLMETDIAERLEVSRTPVRSALQRLQQEGYIVDSPTRRQSRPTVAPLSVGDISELYDIISQLESLAAANAAQLAPRARQELTRELTRLNNDLRKVGASRAPDRERLAELDEAFHSLIVQSGAGPRLKRLHAAVKPQAERYLRIYVSHLAGMFDRSTTEHREIIEAITAGDAAAAREAVAKNWHNATDRLSKVIEQAGEFGHW
jgi:DNA-binding GntR family transcriptional regulator